MMGWRSVLSLLVSPRFLFLFFTLLGGYAYFGYGLLRSQSLIVVTLWCILFISSVLVIRATQDWRILLGITVVVRMIFLGAWPSLSQDFYRFIWDGRMWLAGHNPYMSLPETWVAGCLSPIDQLQELYQGMGPLNASHYTNYPPVSQLSYALAAWLGGTSVWATLVVLRLQLIAADIGVFFFGSRLLKVLGLPQQRIFWYLLNPLVIIELCGNLHFEGLMVFFLVASLYFLQKGYWYLAALLLGMAVGVKLIPLIFLPVFIQKFHTATHLKVHWRWLKYGLFCATILLVQLLLFSPFMGPELTHHYMQSIALWFQNFEFNASVYYLIRWLGYQFVGWNTIAIVGKVLPVLVLLFVLVLSVFRKNRQDLELISSMMLVLCVYYFLSTTVHPWYLSVPLLLSVFTRYRFVQLWTLLVALSYIAYGSDPVQEHLGWMLLEYIPVFVLLIYELRLGGPQEKCTLAFQNELQGLQE